MADRWASWWATQTAAGWEACPRMAGLAGRGGQAAWTAQLTKGAVSGDLIRQRYGVCAGQEERPEELVIGPARRPYTCGSCPHLISAGQMHGVSLCRNHFCACCVVDRQPGTVFTSGTEQDRGAA
jgi:hypothetical protein